MAVPNNKKSVIARSGNDVAISQKQSLTPKLRFKEFEGEWELERMESLVNGISSGTVKPENEGDYLVYGSTGVIGKSNNFTHDGDYILIARVGANAGKINRVSGKYSVTDNTLIIDSKKEVINNCFIEGFLINYDLNRLIFGSGQPLITGGLLKSLKLNIPQLPEQQKIASFLTSVDKKIQQLTKKKTLLQQYKKGVMQQLFSGELRFKTDDGKDFPKWEEKKLGEVFERNSVKNKDNKVNFVLTNSATKGIVSQLDYFDKDIANKNNLQGYYIVSKDDFVYNPRISVHAPVGPIKRNKKQEGVMSPLYSVFRFNKGVLEYFEYFFETVLWHKYLNSIANFGARHDRMNITNADFFKMPIPFPSIKEQQKIANYLSALDTKIENVNNQINQTQTFKKGLLQQLFV